MVIATVSCLNWHIAMKSVLTGKTSVCVCFVLLASSLNMSLSYEITKHVVFVKYCKITFFKLFYLMSFRNGVVGCNVNPPTHPIMSHRHPVADLGFFRGG